jgi:hypothetical protein
MDQQPKQHAAVLELNFGGVHLTVQRIPRWLVALITTAGGSALTWWMQR